MRLRKVRVTGYQSFSDSGDVEFLDGINLIIGQNNAGKSSFLRALLPDLHDDRHRTPERWEAHRLPAPEIAFEIDASGAEIRDWVLRVPGLHYIPVTSQENSDVKAVLDRFFSRSQLVFSMTLRQGGTFASYPSHQLFNYVPTDLCFSATVSSTDGTLVIRPTNDQMKRDSLPGLLHNARRRDMFYFAAERMTIGEAAVSDADRLQPNANNLPNVLQMLYGERGNIFRRLVNHLREIFSSVGNLSVRIKPQGNQLEVRVWPTEAMEHVDLSFPLNSSGTGVSQVVAILTAIMTIDKGIFIIDEINSFLHPAAVKSLLRILQTQYAQHQYIISTHSPDVIGFSNPKTIHLVKRMGYESSIKPLDLTEVGRFREVAEHLGVSMADVFSAERVIWVEGPTEELCFPYLYQKLVGPMPPGTVITSVAATGDFNSKKRDTAMVYEVYSRLSAAASTLVVAVAFSFDTEKLTDSEKAEMQRNSGGRLHFLPRRHFECYLVDPTAIAAFINTKFSYSAGDVTAALVEDTLKELASKCPLHIKEWTTDITEESWLARVDSAKLIAGVCGKISNEQVRFVKREESLFLLQNIIERDRPFLDPLRDYIVTLIDAVTRA